MIQPYIIYLDGNILVAKKYKNNETLNNIRKNLSEKINSSIMFINHGIPINIEDEYKYALKEIEEAGKIFLKHNTYKIFLNNKFLTDYFGDENEKLINIRKILRDKIPLNSIFLYQRNAKIEKEDEEGENAFLLSDIQKNGKIYIVQEVNKKNIEFEKSELYNENDFYQKVEYLIFFENKKLCNYLFKPTTPLNLVRKEIEKKFINLNNWNFLYGLKEINKEEEYILKIKDIEEERIIYLKKNMKQNKENEILENKINDNNLKKKNLKPFFFEFRNEKFVEVFEPEESLSSIRRKLKDKITNDICFVYDENPISLKDEEKLTISLISNKSRIVLKKIEEDFHLLILEENHPIPGSTLISEEHDLKIYKYPDIEFTKEQEEKAISFIVVGETGNGKTTLLNSFINYILGVKFEDKFRYKIIVENLSSQYFQSRSQTDHLYIYNIASHNSYPPLKIIDTPGFGDTQGITRDERITKLFKDKFEKEIDAISAIGFVNKSTQTRVTSYQAYIFENILNLFGKDISENFIFLMTFSDYKSSSPFQSILLSSHENIRDIIKSIKYPWFFQFNNSAIFTSEKNEFDKIFWKLGMENYEGLMKKLLSLPSKSLILTKEVLQKRDLIKTYSNLLNNEIIKGLHILELIKIKKDKIDLLKSKKEDSKDYIVEDERQKIRVVKLKPGEYATNCLICHTTCCYPCYIHDDNKFECDAFHHEFCTICPKKCHYSEHKNTQFRYEIENIKEKFTFKKIKNIYSESKKCLSILENENIILNKNFQEIQNNCIKLQENIKNNSNRLNEISINSASSSPTIDYINSLIEQEKNFQKPGSLERINKLENLKKLNIDLKNLYETKENKIKEYNNFYLK